MRRKEALNLLLVLSTQKQHKAVSELVRKKALMLSGY
jgi:hypothetical protein